MKQKRESVRAWAEWCPVTRDITEVIWWDFQLPLAELRIQRSEEYGRYKCKGTGHKIVPVTITYSLPSSPKPKKKPTRK